MATTKVTFTLDRITLSRLQEAAARLSLPKSAIVREAISEYHHRLGKLSEAERLRMLRALDEMLPKVPRRPASAVDRELDALKRSRRSGGRRS